MKPSTLRFACCRRRLLVLAVLCLARSVFAQTVTFQETAEEFSGPFPSWKNVQTDYGAKGDGATDDTAAIQAAIDDLLAPIRALRIEAPLPRAHGVTDVKIHRVLVRASQGRMGLVIRR